MNLETQEVDSYKNGVSDYSIKDDNIYSIYKDTSGRIWIGSSTGLQYYNEQTDDFRRIKEEIIKKTRLTIYLKTIEALYGLPQLAMEFSHTTDSQKYGITIYQHLKHKTRIPENQLFACYKIKKTDYG